MGVTPDRLHRPGGIADLDDERYHVLRGWIVSDVAYLEAALACLAHLDEIAAGHDVADELSGDGWTVSGGPDQLTFTPDLATGEATYSLAEVRAAVEELWRRLSWPDRPELRRQHRPDLPAWQAALTWWEERHGRPHPYGDRLYRPPTQ